MKNAENAKKIEHGISKTKQKVESSRAFGSDEPRLDLMTLAHFPEWVHLTKNRRLQPFCQCPRPNATRYESYLDRDEQQVHMWPSTVSRSSSQVWGCSEGKRNCCGVEKEVTRLPKNTAVA